MNVPYETHGNAGELLSFLDMAEDLVTVQVRYDRVALATHDCSLPEGEWALADLSAVVARRLAIALLRAATELEGQEQEQ